MKQLGTNKMGGLQVCALLVLRIAYSSHIKLEAPIYWGLQRTKRHPEMDLASLAFGERKRITPTQLHAFAANPNLSTLNGFRADSQLQKR